MKLEFKKLNYDLYIKIYNFRNYMKLIENKISIKLRYFNFLKKKKFIVFLFFNFYFISYFKFNKDLKNCDF